MFLSLFLGRQGPEGIRIVLDTFRISFQIDLVGSMFPVTYSFGFLSVTSHFLHLILKYGLQDTIYKT